MTTPSLKLFIPSHSFFWVFPSHCWRKWTPFLLSFPPCCLIRWLALPSPLGLIQCWGSNFITGFFFFLFFLLWSHGQLHFQSHLDVRRGRSLSPQGIWVIFYCLEIEQMSTIPKQTKKVILIVLVFTVKLENILVPDGQLFICCFSSTVISGFILKSLCLWFSFILCNLAFNVLYCILLF